MILGATTGRISGVDVFSVNLARGLLRQGHDVRIVVTAPDDRVPDPLPLPGDVPSEPLRTPPGSSWPARWAAMRSYLEERAPCVYVPNYDWRHSCVSPVLSRRVAVVGIVHSDDPAHYEHVKRLGRYWNAVVGVSREVSARTRLLDPSLAPRLSTIPYGVPVPDTLPVKAPAETLRIVYAGRLVEQQKRVLDLARVVGACLARGVPAELTVVGAGADGGRLEAACRSLGTPGAVRFLGALPNAEVHLELERNDVFILTSAYEGLPVSLLEAMARGCVPVVTRVKSGVSECVRDGENGFLVPVGDVEAFAERLRTLHADAPLRRRLAAAARDTIVREGYDAGTMVSRYTALFGQVLDRAESGTFTRPPGTLLPPPSLRLPRRVLRRARYGIVSVVRRALGLAPNG